MKTFNSMTEMQPRSLMVVDQLNLCFRYSRDKVKDFADDYIKTVESLKRSYHCDKVIIACDKGSSSYRKGIFPEYKYNRKAKYEEQSEAEAEEFREFLAEAENIISMYEEQAKYPVIRFKGVEADDIAAYICRKRKALGIEQVWLISSDRDYNLMIEPGVSQFSYVNRKEFTVDNWSDHYDYAPEDHISIKVLQGDSGDNVPGVPGIGPKKALELIQTYGSAYDVIAALPITSKYKHIANLNSFGADNLMLNYKLMDLVTFCAEAIGEDNCATIDRILDEYLGV